MREHDAKEEVAAADSAVIGAGAPVAAPSAGTGSTVLLSEKGERR